LARANAVRLAKGIVRAAKLTRAWSKREVPGLTAPESPEMVKVGRHSGRIFRLETKETVMKLLAHGKGELW